MVSWALAVSLSGGGLLLLVRMALRWRASRGATEDPSWFDAEQLGERGEFRGLGLAIPLPHTPFGFHVAVGVWVVLCGALLLLSMNPHPLMLGVAIGALVIYVLRQLGTTLACLSNYVYITMAGLTVSGAYNAHVPWHRLAGGEVQAGTLVVWLDEDKAKPIKASWPSTIRETEDKRKAVIIDLRLSQISAEQLANVLNWYIQNPSSADSFPHDCPYLPLPNAATADQAGRPPQPTKSQ